MLTLLLLFVLVLVVLIGLATSLNYIPNDRVGVVEKLWSFKGSLDEGVIALKGEAGYQPDLLRGGWHILVPFQYRIHRMPLVTIPQGHIGYLFARDGRPLPPEQALANNEQANDFQDVRTFLDHGGQRGPQRKILREGTYAINLVQFVVLASERPYFLALEPGERVTFQHMAQMIAERGGFEPVVIKGTDDVMGIVTVHDGPSLPSGQIIAPTVGDDATQADTYHNNFQDPERFLHAGGRRGRQLQSLVEGTYYINRVFATVEMIPKTVVEVGTSGVVVS